MGSDEDRDLWGAKEERDHPAFCSERRWAATLLKAASRARERERGRWGDRRGEGDREGHCWQSYQRTQHRDSTNFC